MPPPSSNRTFVLSKLSRSADSCEEYESPHSSLKIRWPRLERRREDRRMQQVFIRWTWLRAVLHNGWWLVTSVYLVVDAGLSPAQLVLIGSVQGGFSLVFEVP